MKSPFTGGQAVLKTEKRELTFRKESYIIKYNYYECQDTGEQFTTKELDQINQTQVHNLYRRQHSIPFPEELVRIREKYELSARKMSLILEFGENQYNQYENGSMPSVSNARLIQAAEDPEEFKKFLTASNVYKGKELDQKLDFINRLSFEESKSSRLSFAEFLFGSTKPNEFNGFREPSLKKAMHMINYFAQHLNPWETGMNKLMFYSDFSNFKRTCYSISGMEYRAIQFGPVPKRYGSLFEKAEENGFIIINYDKTKYENTLCKQFLPGKFSFDESVFSENELETLQSVCRRFDGLKTSEISDISHEEDAWLHNIDVKDLINYLYAFDLKALDY